MHTTMMRISAGNGENLSPSSSTSLVINNDDLLIKILLCLPVKYLFVLKLVSKHWYSLTFCNSYFMQKHCELHNNKLSLSGLYFLDKARDIPTYAMTLLDEAAKISSNIVSFLIQQPAGEGLYVEQSCSGLLLCRSPSGYYNGIRYVYNPSTRRCRMIPPPPLYMNLSYSCCWKFYLAFSPQKSLYYEIVYLQRNCYDKTNYEHQMAVYSSKTCSWRVCGCVKLPFKLITGRHCVTWNGCLNWMDGPTLYYFNIAQQVLKTSQSSDELTRKYWIDPYYFEECVGHMYLILEDRAGMSNVFLDIFEMEIDYRGWTQICRVNLGGLVEQYGVYCRIIKVAHVQGDGDENELKVFILFPGTGKIVSYDPKKKNFEEVCNCQMDLSRTREAPAYIESFADV